MYTSTDLFFCGSFNLYILNVVISNKVSSFYDTLHSLGHISLITEPTRITHESQILLYSVLVSKPYNHTSDVLTLNASDHSPLFSTLKGMFKFMNRKQTVQYRVLNDKTLEQFHDNLSAKDYKNVMDSWNKVWAVSELDRVSFEE